jgi:nucleotide-binding universal stress UspA family protein
MKILLAIDESACSEAATQAVMRQFRPEGTDVRVLHVDEWPKGLPMSLDFVQGSEAASQVESTREAIRRRGDALMSDAVRRLEEARFQASSEMRHGDARHAILDCAADWHPDLIVLGSHGRQGLDRFLLGSVSDNVVRHATCSVEVVRQS